MSDKPTDNDATHILASDHRTVESLFEDYEEANGTDRKRAIAEEICRELKIHAMIEEEIFYPALKGKIDEDLLVRRQNIWHNSRRRIAECGPRLGLMFRRRACGVASADVRVSFA